MVFQQNLLEKAYFIAKISGPATVSGHGPAGQFRLLESAVSYEYCEIAQCSEVVFTPSGFLSCSH